MFKPYNLNQEMLLPTDLKEIIPKEDLVFTIAEAVHLLDLEPLYNRYCKEGQHGYHPAMLLSVLFYSYAKGVFSSRKIAQQLKENVRFMYLSGRQSPDFRTISDFRKNNIDLMKGYFAQIVVLCMNAGIVPLNSVSIDSSKFHASASNKKTLKKEELLEKLKATEKEIEKLLREAEKADEQDDLCAVENAQSTVQNLQKLREKMLEAKKVLDENPGIKNVNTTDPESRMFPGKGPNYLGQISVDADTQVILSEEAVSAGNDVNQLLTQIAQTEENTNSRYIPKDVYADCGYANIQAFEQLTHMSHINGFIPTRNLVRSMRNGSDPYDRRSFHFDLANLRVSCPKGKKMKFCRRGCNERGNTYLKFISRDCKLCESKIQCIGAAQQRTLIIWTSEAIVRKMEAKLLTPAGRLAMKIRKQTVEPVFGIIKHAMGFRRFSLRGLEKVDGELALVCSAFNLRKLHKLRNRAPLSEVKEKLCELLRLLFFKGQIQCIYC